MKHRTWENDLREGLKDPESVAYFANAQQESLKKLVRAGVRTIADFTSLEMNKTYHLKWEVE